MMGRALRAAALLLMVVAPGFCASGAASVEMDRLPAEWKAETYGLLKGEHFAVFYLINSTHKLQKSSTRAHAFVNRRGISADRVSVWRGLRPLLRFTEQGSCHQRSRLRLLARVAPRRIEALPQPACAQSVHFLCLASHFASGMHEMHRMRYWILLLALLQ